MPVASKIVKITELMIETTATTPSAAQSIRIRRRSLLWASWPSWAWQDPVEDRQGTWWASRQYVEEFGENKVEVKKLIAMIRNLAGAGSVPAAKAVAEGLAALYAYESQIPEVSRSKREGLAAFYGISDSEATRFFSVHEKADVWHRQVEREALGKVAATPEERERALAAASRCLDALNRALDGVLREIGRA